MNRNFTWAGAAAFILLCTLPGCQTPPHRPLVQKNTAKNSLFNPQWIITPGNDLARNDWPVATAYEHQREEFEYRETIIDRQGRRGSEVDYFSRRFDSTRTGRTRR